MGIEVQDRERKWGPTKRWLDNVNAETQDKGLSAWRQMTRTSNPRNLIYLIGGTFATLQTVTIHPDKITFKIKHVMDKVCSSLTLYIICPSLIYSKHYIQL